jgi:hypothetical protein
MDFHVIFYAGNNLHDRTVGRLWGRVETRGILTCLAKMANRPTLIYGDQVLQ